MEAYIAAFIYSSSPADFPLTLETDSLSLSKLGFIKVLFLNKSPLLE